MSVAAGRTGARAPARKRRVRRAGKARLAHPVCSWGNDGGWERTPFTAEGMITGSSVMICFSRPSYAAPSSLSRAVSSGAAARFPKCSQSACRAFGFWRECNAFGGNAMLWGECNAFGGNAMAPRSKWAVMAPRAEQGRYALKKNLEKMMPAQPPPRRQKLRKRLSARRTYSFVHSFCAPGQRRGHEHEHEHEHGHEHEHERQHGPVPGGGPACARR